MTRMLGIRHMLAAAILVSRLWAQDNASGAPNQAGLPPKESGSTPTLEALSDSTELEPTKTVLPPYPAAAADRQIEGQVEIRVITFPNGGLERAEIVSGDDFLAQPALDAARQWKFNPFLRNGKPVMAAARILFNFSLGKAQSGAEASAGGTVKSRVIESEPLLQRIRVGSGVAQGLVLHRVQPLYPPEARRARVQGTVVMQAAISREGTIQDLRVISGDPMLVDAALDAVRQWRYRPYILNGDPVEVDTQIEVHFTLSER
jgi:TonB family protein